MSTSFKDLAVGNIVTVLDISRNNDPKEFRVTKVGRQYFYIGSLKFSRGNGLYQGSHGAYKVKIPGSNNA